MQTALPIYELLKVINLTNLEITNYTTLKGSLCSPDRPYPTTFVLQENAYHPNHALCH